LLSNSQSGSYLSEAIENNKLIKSLNAEKSFIEKFKKSIHLEQQAKVKSTFI